MRTMRVAPPDTTPSPRRPGRVRPAAYRVVAAAAAFALSTAALAGCGSSGPGEEAGGTLEVWIYGDDSAVVQEKAAERFNEDSDIQVDLTRIPGDTYQDKLRTAMGTANAPDIFFNWGGASIRPYAEAGTLVDLTPVLNKDQEFRDAFFPSVLAAGEIDGRNYGIPMRGMQPVMLFYNEDVFAEHDAEPPETYQDMLELVDTFKAAGVTPFALGGADSWTELMWVEYLLDRHGGAEVFQRIQGGDASAWGDPAVLAMAEDIRELVDRGAFGTKFASVAFTDGSASKLLATGRAAMHLMGSWEYSEQLANSEEFAENALGYGTFPALPDGEGDPAAVVGNPNNFWSVHSKVKGDERKAAVKFLKQLSASDTYVKALVDDGVVPTTTNAEAMLDDSPNPRFAKDQFALVENAPDFTLSWDQALPAKQVTPMLTNIEKLFNGRLSPEEFAEAMQKLPS